MLSLQYPAITIEATCTPAEVRTDPGKKQDILHAVNTAQVRIFLTDIDIDATGLLTPDVVSTSNFIQSINSAAWEYTKYKKHLTTYRQKSTRSWGKSKLQSQLDSVQHSISESLSYMFDDENRESVHKTMIRKLFATMSDHSSFNKKC